MRTKTLVIFSLLLTVLGAPVFGQTRADSTASIYKGLRLSLFEFQVKEQTAKRITLRCQAANTGRLSIASSQRERLTDILIIEADQQTLPPTLQGREGALKKAVLRKKFDLAAGEVLQNLEIEVPIGPNAELAALRQANKRQDKPGAVACADLVFDTAYVVERTEKNLVVHYVLRNAGTAPANLLGPGESSEDNLAINAYFQRGERLTRGAILADGLFIQLGRETLDGMLRPGQQLHGDLSLSLKMRTRFNPDLILELDPFQRVEECERRNNTRFLGLSFGGN